MSPTGNKVLSKVLFSPIEETKLYVKGLSFGDQKRKTEVGLFLFSTKMKKAGYPHLKRGPNDLFAVTDHFGKWSWKMKKPTAAGCIPIVYKIFIDQNPDPSSGTESVHRGLNDTNHLQTTVMSNTGQWVEVADPNRQKWMENCRAGLQAHWKSKDKEGS